MSIDSVTSSLLSASTTPSANPGALFKQLSDSLSSGDLAGAQAAYQSLQQLAPNGAQAQNSDPNSPFAALGKALQSGDLTGARSAFQQLQAAHKGHHHHHHHAAQASGAEVTQKPTQALAPDGAGNEIDITT